jgi:ABC-type anion transport system duplicated permease subunit
VIFMLPTFLAEALVAYRVLTRSQAEVLQLSLQRILAAIDPDTWCPLLIAVVVTHLLLKAKVNKTVAMLVGGLSGLCYTLYQEGNSGLNDFSCELMRYITAFSICQCIINATKGVSSYFFAAKPSNTLSPPEDQVPQAKLGKMD